MIKRIGQGDHGLTNKFLKFAYQEAVKTIDGKVIRPDLTIRGNDKNIPTTYLDYLKKPENREAKTKFINSLKNDVKSISDKYLERISFKAKFAILLVPSDSLLEAAINLGRVYGVAESSKEQMNYIELCFYYKVVPTSPATLIAVISTLERYYDLFDGLEGQVKNIKGINNWLKRKDNIDNKLLMIVDLVAKITKKADEIKGQMKLNCKTAAKLPSPAE